ncbi:hypothetical protein BUE80_DR011948 [Diplocarpon rosae]|nr:hypothetical protein BUE80_DR011948 [Diplocarpon rosae]
MADPQRVWGDRDSSNDARSSDRVSKRGDEGPKRGGPVGGVGQIMQMGIPSSTQVTGSQILSQFVGTQYDAPPSSQPRPESSDEEEDQEDTMMAEPKRDFMISQTLLLSELLPPDTPRTQHDLLQVKTSIQDFACEHPFWTQSLLEEDEALEFEQDVFKFAIAAGLTVNLAKIEVMRAMGKWKAAKGLALGGTGTNDDCEASESAGVVLQSTEEVIRGSGNVKKRKRDIKVEENVGDTVGGSRSALKRKKKRDKKKGLGPDTEQSPIIHAPRKDRSLENASVKSVGGGKQEKNPKKDRGPTTSSYFGRSAAVLESSSLAKKTHSSSKQSTEKELAPVLEQLADKREEHRKSKADLATTEPSDGGEKKRRKKKRNKNRLLSPDTAAAERAARILARADKPKEFALEQMSFEHISEDGASKGPPKKKRRVRTKRIARANGNTNLEASGVTDGADPETKPTDVQDGIETVDKPPAKKKSRNWKKKGDAPIEQCVAPVVSEPASCEGVPAPTAESTVIQGQTEAIRPPVRKSRNRKQKEDAGAEISSTPVDSKPTPSEALPTQDVIVADEKSMKTRKEKVKKPVDKLADVEMGGSVKLQPLVGDSQASSGGGNALLVDHSSICTDMQEASVVFDTWGKARSASVAICAENASVYSGHTGHERLVPGLNTNKDYDIMPETEDPVQRKGLPIGKLEREPHGIVFKPSDSFTTSLPPDVTQNAAGAEADDNASVWSFTHYGSLDWDHSGDEFEAIQANRKITRRCSNISPRDKLKVQATFTGAVTPTKQKPEYSMRSVSEPPCTHQKRDAHGRFAPRVTPPLDVPIQQKETPTPFSKPVIFTHTKTPITLGNLPVPSEGSQDSSATIRDSKGRFAKKAVVAQAENPALGVDYAVLEEEVTSIPVQIATRAKRAKRAPAKSPYFSPPDSPPKSRKGTKKAEAGPNPLKTPRKASSSLSQSPGKDVDSTSPPQGSARKRPPAKVISCIPFPPFSAPHFGLIQEKLAQDPFRLLIAVTFLIRTHGKHAIPVFFELMERYPTPEALVAAEKDDILRIIRHLGLQNQRASTYQMYAKIWVEDPPKKDKCYPVRGYSGASACARCMRCDEAGVQGVGLAALCNCKSNIKKGEMTSDSGDRSAWEIGHMTQGPYAIDSWRIFCRDVLRGVAQGWNGEGAIEGFQPEWMRVLPEDKELRAYLRWMWLKEGFYWDPFTGDKEVAGQELMRAALEGRIAWDDEGGMRILDEGMALEPGLSQVGAVVEV